MGCCGGHFEMHDGREKRAQQQETHPHGRGESSASFRPVGGSLSRWIAPLVLGLGVALVYLILFR